MIASNPDVIYAATGRLVLKFKAATTTIPIVAGTSDPVAAGIVTSLAHPDGNITGVSVDAGSEIWGKRLEILNETISSRLSKVGFLASTDLWQSIFMIQVRDAFQRAGISPLGPPLLTPLKDSEYRRALNAMTEQGVDGLVVSDQVEHIAYRQVIADLASDARLPTIYPYREFVDAGGLVAYSTDLLDAMRGAADQVSRILKGASPGELPFYQPTKFQLAINLKTAKALGLTIPDKLVALADELIE